jgi:putative ABC transport system permease protein
VSRRFSARLLERFPLTTLAWRNLTRTRVRTGLAVLGILVGVVAIASLGVTGVAFQESQVDSFDRIGSTVLIEPGEDAESLRLDADDRRLVQSNTDYPTYTFKQTTTNVSHLRTDTTAPLKSVNRPREQTTVAEGSIPVGWRDGVAVGSELAEELGVGVGDALRVDGETQRVIAVFAENEDQRVFSTDESVVVPSERHPNDEYTGIYLEAENFASAFAERDRLDSALNYQEERYAVQDFEDAVSQILQLLAQINVFLVGIGAVSLFVASVSIVNVMLMSTIERRGEIGVFRAVGYQRLAVLRLLLTEALLMGVVGAVLGVALSLAVGAAVNAALLGDPLAFSDRSLQYLAFGFVFGLVASLLAGLYPAWRAASDPPVESLRG